MCARTVDDRRVNMKKAACVGCGATDNTYGRPRWTKANPLCPSCREILERHQKEVDKLKSAADLVPVGAPEYLSNDYVHRPRYANYKDDDRLERAWRAFITACPPVQGYPNNHINLLMSLRGRNPRLCLYLPRGIAKPLAALLHVLVDHTHAAYNEGFKDGTNILKRLGDGTLTADEVNEMCLKKAKGNRR